MATDPNQILATGAANPFVPQGQYAGGPHNDLSSLFSGMNMQNIIQSAQAGHPADWATFMQQPWAQALQQRFPLQPEALSRLQQLFTGGGMPAPYRPPAQFQPQQVVLPGMVPGVPGSMGLAPGGPSPIMTPGGGGTGAPVMAPPQHQQGQRMSPMLPQGFGQGGGMASPIAGLARQPNMPGFGL